MAEHTFQAIGTSWRIITPEPLDGRTITEIDDTVMSFDQTWSRFRADSTVTAMATAAGHFRVPTRDTGLLELYRRLYDATGGAVTPLVGATLAHLGYDAAYSLRRRPGGCPVPRWDDRLRVDGVDVRTGGPVLLDVGAAGKGWLVDLIAGIVRRATGSGSTVDGSGDIVHDDDTEFLVGLENPDDPATVIGVARLHGQGFAASAVNRRRWGPGLHHVIDPRTAEPATGLLATWVVAENAALADGLATALFLTDPDRLRRRFVFDYVRMADDRSVEWSAGFPGEVFR